MWKITPLHVGTLDTIMCSVIMKHGVKSNPGELTQLYHIAWLLEDEERGRKVLVDTGGDDNLERNSRLHNPIRRDEGKHVIEMLARHGVKPEQLDAIIITHLHWDHAQAILDLPRDLPVYVQREELHFALDPYPTDRKYYEADATDQVPYYLQCYHQYKLVDGDVEIEPGLSVVHLPGHSNGSQGVVVDTKDGRFVIAGDMINIRANWEQRMPGGLYNDIKRYFDSFAKLEKLEKEGAVILPSHDRWVLDTYPVIG
ncbi:MAG: N-acyl homoserine lactonase family protein [Desulfovibrio sp.]|nr:N-acyl homoserine lactonase family protein [Desulfovibrio sp.]